MALGPKDPRRVKAADRLAKIDFERKEKERKRRKYIEEHTGERKINGRFYKEHASGMTKHDALKLEKELKATTDLSTRVLPTKAGHTLYVLST
jgi:hypothetical protein